MIEDVASHFGMGAKDCIARIEQLQEQERLTGITDDRGKFIHITKQEFESVANFMRAKGRVSRADLLTEANKLVRLEPTKEDQKLI